MKIFKRPVVIIVLIILTLIAVPLFYAWNGNFGIIARDSIRQTIEKVPQEEHIVKVYSGGTEIYEFKGYYTVENYGGYYVILDFENDIEVLRLNFYGGSTITDVPIEEESNAVVNN